VKNRRFNKEKTHAQEEEGHEDAGDNLKIFTQRSSQKKFLNANKCPRFQIYSHFYL